MAINPVYPHDSVISKVQVGSTVYYMKDADLRSIVNAFGNATAEDVAVSIANGGTGLTTSDQVYDFVIDQIGGLGTVLNLLTASDHTAVSTPKKGDFVVESDGKEWLYDGSAWREVGDETAYVLKTTTIAGIDLQDSITATELKNALSLKALAYADTASVTVSDYATGITGASYTPAGSVSVTLDQTSTAATLTTGDYTPAGSVSVTLDQTSTAASLTKGDYTPAGTVSVSLDQTATAATLTKGDYTPAGSVSISADNSGTQISGTNASSAVTITPSTSAFAVEGVTAAMDTTDTEMLVLTAASTSSAWTGYTAATAAAQAFTGDKFSASFTGTKAENALVTAVSYDKASVDSASFTGTTATNALVTAVNYDKASVDSATFTGTKAEDILVTAVNYDKASVDDASFTGTAATITPTLNTGSKTITVSPDVA